MVRLGECMGLHLQMRGSRDLGLGHNPMPTPSLQVEMGPTHLTNEVMSYLSRPNPPYAVCAT